MQGFLDTQFWGNTILDYMVFLGSLIISFIVLLVIKRVLLRRLMIRAEKTPTSLDDMILKKTKRYLLPLFYIGAVYFNLKWLKLSEGVSHVVDVIALACVMILGAVVLASVLIFVFNKYFESKQKVQNRHAMRWIGGLIKVVVYTSMLLLFLDIQNVPITTLIAVLGVGGIAIAFAAQTIIEDIFGFVTIFFDRPFEIGDFVVIDTYSGTVEHIGMKTTRVRSLSGEQLVFSNKDLTSARLHNYKRMDTRRVVFTIGVTYDTATETLKEIPVIIKEIIDRVEQTNFDRSHFKEFADFSLNFETVYYVLSQDYNVYMDVQQAINFAIKQTFDERGIEFAFPTQTLYVQNPTELT